MYDGGGCSLVLIYYQQIMLAVTLHTRQLTLNGRFESETLPVEGMALLRR